jgi:hypothetical protein
MARVVMNQKKVLKELQKIPGIGKSISLDLWNLGIREISDLKDKNPALLYEHSNKLAGVIQDKCLLYTFRCAVYFASEQNLNKEKLNWWYWKDELYNEG